MLRFDFWRMVRLSPDDPAATPPAGGDTPKPGEATPPAGGDNTPKPGEATPPGEKKTLVPEVKPAAFDEKAFGESRTARVASEVYDDKYTLPEGIKADADGLKALNELGKSLGLTKAELQQFVDLQVQRGVEATKAADADWANMLKGWVDACKNDKDFGGDAYDANKGLVTRVAKALDPELPAELEKLGLNDNPVVFRALARLGTKLGDDKLVFGSAKPSAGDTLRGLYNHPTSNPQS